MVDHHSKSLLVKWGGRLPADGFISEKANNSTES